MFRILSNSNETLGYYDNIYGKLYDTEYRIITSDIDQEEGRISNNETCKNIIITIGNSPKYPCTYSNLFSNDYIFDIDKTRQFLNNLEQYLSKHNEIEYIDLYTTELFKYCTLVIEFFVRFKEYKIRVYTDSVRELTLAQVFHLCRYDNVEIHTNFANSEYERKIIEQYPNKFWLSVDISPKSYILFRENLIFSNIYNNIDMSYPKDMSPIIEYVDYTNIANEDDNKTLRESIKDFCINDNGLNKCFMFGRIANRLFSPKLDIQDCSTNHCLLNQVKPIVCNCHGDIIRCPNCNTSEKFTEELYNKVGELKEDTSYRRISDNHRIIGRNEFKYIDKCLDCDVKAFCNFCDIDTSEQTDNLCCNKVKVIYGGVLDAIISMQFGDSNFKLEEV